VAKIVTFETNKGTITAELFEGEAPLAAANFEKLANDKFYDGVKFHRVIADFVVQGGDPKSRDLPNGHPQVGTGGPGYTIPCETAGNPHKHKPGALSMAHAGKNTGGSQFFLTFRPTEHLDGKHTVFGRVIQGFDVLPKLTRTQSNDGQPIPGLEPDTIVKAKVLRKRDHAYEPKTSPDQRK
jgi:peptidyl-prolyl cis-trans isomerase B (cyclophilin B)